MRKLIFSDEIGVTTGVATTLTALTGSPYSPLVTGRLIQVKVGASGDAATSLIENVTIVLTCTLWGVPLYVTLEGGGIRTATTPPIPKGIQNCDLPVKTGVNITAQYMHQTGATPVTPRVQVIGVFEGRPAEG